MSRTVREISSHQLAHLTFRAVVVVVVVVVVHKKLEPTSSSSVWRSGGVFYVSLTTAGLPFFFKTYVF